VVRVGSGLVVLVGLEEVRGKSRHIPRNHHPLRGGGKQGSGRRRPPCCSCSCSCSCFLLLLLLEELQLL